MTIRESDVYQSLVTSHQSPVTNILSDYTIFTQEKPSKRSLRGFRVFQIQSISFRHRMKVTTRVKRIPIRMTPTKPKGDSSKGTGTLMPQRL